MTNYVTLICPSCDRLHIDVDALIAVENKGVKKINFFKTPHRKHYCNYCQAIFQHPNKSKNVSVDNLNPVKGVLINQINQDDRSK